MSSLTDFSSFSVFGRQTSVGVSGGRIAVGDKGSEVTAGGCYHPSLI